MRDMYFCCEMMAPRRPYIRGAWVALLLLFLCSCREGNPPIDSHDDEDMTICFSVIDPIPSTREAQFVTDLEAEKTIFRDRIWVYEFLAREDASKPPAEQYDGSLYLSAKRLSLTKTDGSFGNDYEARVKPELFLGYIRQKHPDEKRILVFVANAPSFRAEMVSGTTTLGDFLSYAMTKCVDGGDPSQIFVGEKGHYMTHIPMMGIGYTGRPRDDNYGSPVEIKERMAINVNLVRMVARIDVATSIGSGQTTRPTKKLVVKSMRLYNAPCYSTLGERRPFRASGSDPRIDDADVAPQGVLCGEKGLSVFRGLDKSYPRLSFEDKEGDGYVVRLKATGSEPEIKGLDPQYRYNYVPGHLACAFYLYESPLEQALPEDKVSNWSKDSSQGIPYLHLVVIYGDGPERDLYVPFLDKEGKPIKIKRNNSYVILLGPRWDPNKVNVSGV